MKLYILLFFLIFNNILLAKLDSTKNNDTNNANVIKTNVTKEIILPAIEVTEPRIENSAIKFSPNTNINIQNINTILPMQLSEILVFAPGVYISNYGGLESMKTISIRGAGSMRSLILVDGLPVNSAQNASFDLNNIVVSLIDNIEIVRGGASTIFGGNAIGGAVNIRTNSVPKETIKTNISYGSFREFGANITGNYVENNSKNSFLNFLSANFNYQNSKGNFPFTYSQFGKENIFYRENADYENLSLSLAVKGNIADWDTWLRAICSNTDKGVPGAILQGQINRSNSRLTESNYTLLINSHKIFNSNSSLLISGIYKYNNTIYFEPSKSLQSNSEYLLNDLVLNGKYNLDLFGLQHELLASFSYCSLLGDMLDPTMENFVYRNIFALGYIAEKDFLINENCLQFNIGGRLDNSISKQNNNAVLAMSGTFGAIYDLKSIPILFRTNISHNFRFPNFNEMYYRNYGTKNLLPEQSNNINLGINYEIFNLLNISIDYFYINTKNMITAIPTSPISWSAKNLDKVESTGIEFTFSTIKSYEAIKDRLKLNLLSFSYTLQQIVDKSVINSIGYGKQLPYTPNELLNVLLSLWLYNFEFGVKCEYSSFRYVQADNNNNIIIPSYVINSLFVSKKINFNALKFIFRVDFNNIFDKKYEIINNYIMPGRQIRGSIGVEY